MKGYIVYLPEYESSVQMAERAYATGYENGWDLGLYAGINGKKQ